jgi:hypothetical protein
MTPEELEAIRARTLNEDSDALLAEVDRLTAIDERGHYTAGALAGQEAERARIKAAIATLDWEGCGGWGCTDNMADVFRQVETVIDGAER